MAKKKVTSSGLEKKTTTTISTTTTIPLPRKRWVGNNSGGGNKNDLRVKQGTISKVCLVCGNEGRWLKGFQKLHVTRIINPEGQVQTVVITPTGTFYLCRKCRWCYNKGKKYYHKIDKYYYKNDISQHKEGDGKGNP